MTEDEITSNDRLCCNRVFGAVDNHIDPALPIAAYREGCEQAARDETRAEVAALKSRLREWSVLVRGWITHGQVREGPTVRMMLEDARLALVPDGRLAAPPAKEKVDE